MADQFITIITGLFMLAVIGVVIWLLIQAVAWIGDLFSK